jgi:hypothetical protein
LLGLLRDVQHGQLAAAAQGPGGVVGKAIPNFRFQIPNILIRDPGSRNKANFKFQISNENQELRNTPPRKRLSTIYTGLEIQKTFVFVFSCAMIKNPRSIGLPFTLNIKH